MGLPRVKQLEIQSNRTETRITHMVNPLTKAGNRTVKTREAGPLPGLILLILEVRTSLTTHAQKDSLEAKEGELCQKSFDTPSLCGRMHLG